MFRAPQFYVFLKNVLFDRNNQYQVDFNLEYLFQRQFNKDFFRPFYLFFAKIKV